MDAMTANYDGLGYPNLNIIRHIINYVLLCVYTHTIDIMYYVSITRQEHSSMEGSIHHRLYNCNLFAYITFEFGL